MPTVTGKKLRYIEMKALGIRPVIPTEFRTTIIIGARASIGKVCEVMTQGITDAFIARLCTIPTASSIPSPEPKAKPNKVAESVTQE